ncbi:MAG: electron transfer flavoprotein subunit beta/FixA family protein [Erysipelotrichaceae bacterium]|nr:electron transfer flavoprotein subunit beta/FixA family protein [Erysipelotrichaceae bacterium]MDD4643152.1 electron transfer flavoprotein subunit beta/FixA family protein [Erysipelotrichaceae bacterium]
MKIIVCIKQVPDTQKVKVDDKTGVLIRDGIDTKMNPFDLYALETAMKIKEQINAEITVITMGPPSAKEVIKEAYALGADSGYLLTDRKFAGADVLATSFTLAQGITAIGGYDLIICGKQTTDGDTAQVGPAIAEHLAIPHVSWVVKIKDVCDKSITFMEDMLDDIAIAKMNYPCLITVDKDVFQPRLPSYRLKQQAETKTINILTLEDLAQKDSEHYGLSGSPTQVEKIFEPTSEHEVERFEQDDKNNAKLLYQKLKELKYVKELS